jgi:Superinfection immunity protein
LVVVALVMLKALGTGPMIVVAVVLGVYFLPSIIANHRKVPNQGSVFVINLFLGWSLIGWVVALAMAARTAPSRVV